MGAIAVPARTLPVVQQPPSTQEPYAIIELGDLRMGRVGMGKVVGTPPPPAVQKKTRSRRWDTDLIQPSSATASPTRVVS